MQLEVGAILEGKITGITKFGAFVELGEGKTGMVHISEVAPTFVKEITDFVSEGQTVKVKVLSVGEDGKISLSMKKAMETASASGQSTQRTRSGRKGPDHFEWSNKKNEATSFEDMLNKVWSLNAEAFPVMAQVNPDKKVECSHSTFYIQSKWLERYL